mmetsp:Transcript_151807/g.487125  ORF Transcript_151807/g.487125 Transcript_151807/m.487125 type:complete len:212 (+) Transcript_151807:1012-1647(+)
MPAPHDVFAPIWFASRASCTLPLPPHHRRRARWDLQQRNPAAPGTDPPAPSAPPTTPHPCPHAQFLPPLPRHHCRLHRRHHHGGDGAAAALKALLPAALSPPPGPQRGSLSLARRSCESSHALQALVPARTGASRKKCQSSLATASTAVLPRRPLVEVRPPQLPRPTTTARALPRALASIAPHGRLEVAVAVARLQVQLAAAAEAKLERRA